MAEEAMYAWTPIFAGGEVKEVKGPGGTTRNVTASRNRIAVGDKVDKAMVTEGAVDPDANWQDLIDSGAIRPYPFPDMDTSSNESPLDYLRRSLREAAEAEISEEQQLLLAVGQGAVVSDEDLAAAQPSDLKSSSAAADKTAAEKSK